MSPRDRALRHAARSRNDTWQAAPQIQHAAAPPTQVGKRVASQHSGALPKRRAARSFGTRLYQALALVSTATSVHAPVGESSPPAGSFVERAAGLQELGYWVPDSTLARELGYWDGLPSTQTAGTADMVAAMGDLQKRSQGGALPETCIFRERSSQIPNPVYRPGGKGRVKLSPGGPKRWMVYIASAPMPTQAPVSWKLQKELCLDLLAREDLLARSRRRPPPG